MNAGVGFPDDAFDVRRRPDDAIDAELLESLPAGATPVAVEPTHDDIARRAYEPYERRGRDCGRDYEDWFAAEMELRTKR